YGELDRIHHSAEGTPLLIDYKTESRARTEARIKQPLEDTQLAFYAALLGAPELRAAYLSLSDVRGGAGETVQLMEQRELLAARDALLDGLLHDLDRIAAGAALPALGEGATCE